MYIDADVLYAYLKPTDWLKKHATNILKLKDLKTSAITVVELELIARRDFDDAFANNILDKLKSVKTLTIVPLTNSVLESAVQLRVNYKLNIFDALHAATALELNLMIISSDSMFDLVKNLERKDTRSF